MAKAKTVKKIVKKVVKTKEKPEKKKYWLRIEVNDGVFDTTTNSFKDALKEFTKSPQFPLGIYTNVIITYGNGVQERSQIYSSGQARRVLNNMAVDESATEILASNMVDNLS